MLFPLPSPHPRFISDVQSDNGDGITNGSFLWIIKLVVVQFVPKRV